MAQMKEQIKTPEKELNKMEISNQSDAEFRGLLKYQLEKTQSSKRKLGS